jgi:putative hemolysin
MSRPATALVVTLATAVLLAGCTDPANGTANPPNGTVGTPNGTASTANGTAGTANGTASPADPDPAGTANPAGVDKQAAASIEDSVSAAEQLLADLEQDFEQDAADAG